MQGPQTHFPELLLEHAEMPRPDTGRVLKKIPECDRIRCQKHGEPLGAFARITAPACSDEIAAGPIATSYSRLHVVDGQLGNIKDITTVDTSVIIAGEYILALH
jgi:hypothetical protein